MFIKASAVLLLASSALVDAQTLPNYEIHEVDYTAANPSGNPSWSAKVIDRVKNKLWMCYAGSAASNPYKPPHAYCKDALLPPDNSHPQPPNLKQLVVAESIGPHSVPIRGIAEHWWFINPQTGDVFICVLDAGCSSAPYQ